MSGALSVTVTVAERWAVSVAERLSEFGTPVLRQVEDQCLSCTELPAAV